jgi:hypothetical protein
MKTPKHLLKPTDRRQYHWLIVGEITFTMKNEKGEEILNISKHNCVLYSLESKITLNQIGRAQQTLQMQLFQKLGTAEGISITNIVILGWMLLGHMTQAEFNLQPNEKSEAADKALTDKAIADKVFGPN